MSTPFQVTYVPLDRQHAGAVAELHIAGIPTGFISSLGPAFVTALYEAIADSPDSFGFMALVDGQVVGYNSVTSNLRRLYRAVLRRAGLKFLWFLAKQMLSFQSLKRILETLLYPQRIRNLRLPDAEFLAGAVVPEARPYGVANRLFELALEECRKRGITEVKSAAAESLQRINKIYQLWGLQVRTTLQHHGVTTNIYVIPTDLFCLPSARRKES
jgi:GNAT superfamily N-acetyltransferase